MRNATQRTERDRPASGVGSRRTLSFRETYVELRRGFMRAWLHQRKDRSHPEHSVADEQPEAVAELIERYAAL